VGAVPFVPKGTVFPNANALRHDYGPRDVQSLCNTGAQRLSFRLTRAPNNSTVSVEKLNARIAIFVDSKFSLRNTRRVDEYKSLSTNFFWWRSLRLRVDERRCRIMRKHSAQQTRSNR
jgi:hypothetical protein